MIRELRIIDLGVIRSATIEPGPSLTAITGETGAGKTMILQSLSLLRGDRADASLITQGSREAVVECDLEISDPQLAQSIEAAGGVFEDENQLLLVRQVTTAGRSKFLAGGRSVPRTVVKDVMNALLTIHGQSDQLRLRDATTQRDLIDTFAGPEHVELVQKYRDLWQQRIAVRQQHQELVDQAAERIREAELLRLGLETIDQVNPEPAEDEALDQEAERLRHSEELREAASRAHGALVGNDTDEYAAAILADQAARELERAAQRDPELTQLSAAARDISYKIAELGTDVARYLDNLVSDPIRLEQIELRRSELAKIARSYGPTLADALNWAEHARIRLTELGDDSATINRLQTQDQELTKELEDIAARISAARRAAADRLSASVDHEFAQLEMPNAHLSVEFEPHDDLGPFGAESLTVMFASHPQATPRPLAKAASGGELSRIMLAIEVVLADQANSSHPLVMIFDEIDAGVGGRTATAIGKRLARLAHFHQVIVVTHLAQVAAQADTHLVVRKDNTRDDGALSAVTRVEDEARIIELARMLSGEDGSQTARAHAQELLSAAGVRG